MLSPTETRPTTKGVSKGRSGYGAVRPLRFSTVAHFKSGLLLPGLAVHYSSEDARFLGRFALGAGIFAGPCIPTGGAGVVIGRLACTDEVK
jgi:hypothetical protein